MIGILFGYIIILAILFGILCNITGEEKKGNVIVVNCITAIVLYALVLELFNGGLPTGGVIKSGLPLVSNVEKAGSVRQYFANSPALFALDFVELVSLTLMINWVSNIFSFENAGFVGKVTSRIIIVLGGIIVYGFFIAFAAAGVNYIVSSLWEVDDFATAVLMQLFSEVWNTGKSVEESLLNAKRKMRSMTADEIYQYITRNDAIDSIPNEILDSILEMDSKRRIFNAPYYWAGFVCYQNARGK